MSELVKYEPHRILGLSTQFIEFTYLSGFNDSDSSFYLALGSGILESLIRLKHSDDINVDLIYNRLKERLSSLENEIENSDHIKPFRRLFEIYKSASIQDSRDYIFHHLTRNRDNALEHIKIGMRFLIAHLDREYNNLMNEPFHLNRHKKAINNFIQELKINIFIIDSDGRQVRLEETDEQGNFIVCLHRDALSKYSVCYHEEHWAIDRNQQPPQEGMTRFPFVKVRTDHGMSRRNRDRRGFSHRTPSRSPDIAMSREERRGSRDFDRYNPAQNIQSFSSAPTESSRIQQFQPIQNANGIHPYGLLHENARESIPPPQSRPQFSAPPQNMPQFSAPPQSRPQFNPPPNNARQSTPPPENMHQFNPPPNNVRQSTPPPENMAQFNPPPNNARQSTPPPENMAQFNPPLESMPNLDYLPVTESPFDSPPDSIDQLVEILCAHIVNKDQDSQTVLRSIEKAIQDFPILDGSVLCDFKANLS